MYESILVPLDGSMVSENALPYAEEIATSFGSEIVLVGVSQSDTTELFRSYLEHVIEQVRSRFKTYAPGKEIRIYTEVFAGEPASSILNCAFKRAVSLIAMTGRGESNQGPWQIGNIAAKVLRASKQPVLLIRAPADHIAQQKRKLFGKILVPLDGSLVGEAAVPFVEVLAQSLGSQVVLLRVIEPPTIWSGIDINISQILSQDFESWKTSVQPYLEKKQKMLVEKGISTSTIVDVGLPANIIIDCAKSKDINLIAMSTHGRSGIGRWVFGSVTDKVLHAGDKAVLVIRAK